MKNEEALLALSALSQETRLRIFRLLVEEGPDGLAAGTLAEKLKVPAATLSFHLKELERGRIIESRRKSRQIFYAADFQGINGLLHFLTYDCCKNLSGLDRTGEQSAPN
jgi:DNA-binding transcriptional ArsR family regulator